MQTCLRLVSRADPRSEKSPAKGGFQSDVADKLAKKQVNKIFCFTNTVGQLIFVLRHAFYINKCNYKQGLLLVSDLRSKL